MVHILTYHPEHRFDLILSCPKCGTYFACISDLTLEAAVLAYDDWRLLGACAWCGGGDGLHVFAGCYYRDYGVYLPFPHLKIATNPIELRRLVDEREFGSYTNDGFGICIVTQPVVDIRNGKLLWSKACDIMLKTKIDFEGFKTITSKLIGRIQYMIFIADYHGVIYNTRASGSYRLRR